MVISFGRIYENDNKEEYFIEGQGCSLSKL